MNMTGDIIEITIDETKTEAFAREIARTAAKLEKLGLGEEAANLRAYARDRIEAARRLARASNPAMAELAELARATAAA